MRSVFAATVLLMASGASADAPPADLTEAKACVKAGSLEVGGAGHSCFFRMKGFCIREYDEILPREDCYRAQSIRFHTLIRKMIDLASGDVRKAMQNEMRFRLLEVQLFMNRVNKKQSANPDWNTGHDRISVQGFPNLALWRGFVNVSEMAFGATDGN